MLKKRLFLLLASGLLLMGTNLRGQRFQEPQLDEPQNKGDYWVVQLPHNGRVEFMLEVDDGYVLYAISGPSADWNTWVPTFYKYSKTGNLLWYREHPDAPRQPNDFIKTQDGGFMALGYGTLFKMYYNGNKQFKFIPNSAMWPGANVYGDKAYSYGTPSRYGFYLQVYPDPNQGYKYPLFVDGGGNLVKIDSVNKFSGKSDFWNISTENTNGNQIFMSYFTQYNRRNFFSDYNLNPIEEKIHFHSTMIYPHKEFGYYRIPDRWFMTYDEGPKYLIRYDDNMDSLWAHEYTDYLMTGIDLIDFKATTSLNDGGFVLAGEVSNLVFHTVWLVKIDRNGNTVWRRGFDYTIFRELAYKGVAEADDGGMVFFTSGKHGYEGAPWDMFLVKTNPDGYLGLDQEAMETEKMVVYPNPAMDKVTLSFVHGFTGILTVQTVSGIPVQTASIYSQVNHELDVTKLPTGIYAIVAVDTKTNNTFFQKFVKL